MSNAIFKGRSERIASRGCVRAVLLQQRFTIRGTLYRVVRQIENIAVCVEKQHFSRAPVTLSKVDRIFPDRLDVSFVAM